MTSQAYWRRRLRRGWRRGHRASALVVTLLAVLLLSIIVVAFMQSMAIERSVSRSEKNRVQAELAAQAGLAEAANRLAGLMAANPYHAIGYTNVGGQTITILAGSTNYTNTTAPTRYFLLSVTNPTVAPTGLNGTNSVAMNAGSSAGGGWMGSPVTNGVVSHRDCRAPWIYLLQDASRPHQPNRAQTNYNPYVARYAFWIEDETSKLDFLASGNNAGLSGAFLRSTNCVQPADIDLGAAPLVDGLPLSVTNAAANDAVISFRNQVANLPVDGRMMAQAGFSTNAAETARFYTTMASYANDLAGTGQKRVNLNAIVTDGTNAAVIKSDLDDIIYVISGTHMFTGLNNATDSGLFHHLPNTNATIPSFGARFYNGAPVEVDDPLFPGNPNKRIRPQDIYLKKIAANIRDYIDSDSQPTIVDRTGNVLTNIPSNWHLPDRWPPQAVGKEAIPYLQETAMTGHEVSWSGSGGTRTATLEIDHYLEYYNPSTKDFTAPAGTKIQINNLTSWDAGSHPAIEPPDFELDISGVTFPAGKVTVITTNPGPDPPGLILDPSRVERISVPLSVRLFSNRLTDHSILGTVGFEGVFRDSGGGLLGIVTTTGTDMQARLLMRGPQGLYEGLPNYGFEGKATSLLETITSPRKYVWDFKGQQVGNRTRFVYSTSPKGSGVTGHSGDPRSLSEQLAYSSFVASGNNDNTRFYGNIKGDGVPGTATTLGKAAVSSVNPNNWKDYNPALDDTADTAFAVIRDGPMVSIGELGNIYDPHRTNAATGINFSRGGGRTLKVGQYDDVVGAAARFSAAWQRSAWRLTDIFGANTNKTVPVLDATSRGKVNVNSILRDDGVVLRALLRQFQFLPAPNSDAGISEKPLSDTEIANLLDSIKTYLNANGPMMERGELSQISFFNAGVATNKIADQAFNKTMDRGREEIFRRMVELVTTRSASFAIYAVGEAVQENSAGKIKPLSRTKRGFVFRFEPVFPQPPVLGLRDKATNFTHQQMYEIK